MDIVTVKNKFQIVIPQHIREQVHIEVGDFLEAGSDIEHSLMVGANEECVCVIASRGVPRGLPGILMRLLA